MQCTMQKTTHFVNYQTVPEETADPGEDMYYESGIQTNPLTGLLFSPADMLFGRHCPSLLSNLQLAVVNAREKLPNRQEVYKACYVNPVTSMEPLAVETT